MALGYRLINHNLVEGKIMYQLVRRTIFEALKDRYETKEITAQEVAIELYRAGHYAFVPDKDEALKCIGVMK
jgi:hypothetical protein